MNVETCDVGARCRTTPGAERSDAPDSAGAGEAKSLGRMLARLHNDEFGATSTEYMLILALIVLPIALLFPLFMQMVKTYGGRMTALMGLPFP